MVGAALKEPEGLGPTGLRDSVGAGGVNDDDCMSRETSKVAVFDAHSREWPHWPFDLMKHLLTNGATCEPDSDSEIPIVHPTHSDSLFSSLPPHDLQGCALHLVVLSIGWSDSGPFAQRERLGDAVEMGR